MGTVHSLHDLEGYMERRQNEMTAILDEIVEIAISGICVEDNIRQRSLLELDYIAIRKKLEHAQVVYENNKRKLLTSQ